MEDCPRVCIATGSLHRILGAIDTMAKAEVADFNQEVGVGVEAYQQVRGFDIAVNQSCLMDEYKTLKALDSD